MAKHYEVEVKKMLKFQVIAQDEKAARTQVEEAQFEHDIGLQVMAVEEDNTIVGIEDMENLYFEQAFLDE